ncbi:MAG: winged helix-turn-helix transcriptional regulator [Sphingobacteriales bacterium]|nr:winged helix-turn-helix transcriptional regulator [Sphingobacteriales bacterium]
MKVAFIVEFPTQFEVPFYQYMSKRLKVESEASTSSQKGEQTYLSDRLVMGLTRSENLGVGSEATFEPEIMELAGGVQVVFSQPKTNLKTNLKINLKINLKTKVALMNLLQQDPQITIPELSLALEKSRSSVKSYLQQLKQEGKIERIGAKKGGLWKVLDGDTTA